MHLNHTNLAIYWSHFSFKQVYNIITSRLLPTRDKSDHSVSHVCDNGSLQ